MCIFGSFKLIFFFFFWVMLFINFFGAFNAYLAFHYVYHCQVQVERGACELPHFFFHYIIQWEVQCMAVIIFILFIAYFTFYFNLKRYLFFCKSWCGLTYFVSYVKLHLILQLYLSQKFTECFVDEIALSHRTIINFMHKTKSVMKQIKNENQDTWICIICNEVDYLNYRSLQI